MLNFITKSTSRDQAIDIMCFRS